MSFYGRMAPTAITLALCAGALAQPVSPTYFGTFGDAVTGDNAYFDGGFRYWDVDAGSDSYQNDFYERPQAQTFGVHGGRYWASEYFEYIDIVQARIGFDDNYLYASINLFGLNKSTTDGVDTRVGLMERYGFRIGPHVDGRGSLLLVADQPETANPVNTEYGRLKTFGYADSDGDVGGRGLFAGGPTGLGVTRTDNPLEEVGMNGYDMQIISDGRNSALEDVLFARIDPNDETIVEFAFDYTAFGITQGDLLDTEYLEFEAIKGGPKDPQNYLWNDKYFDIQAGSPNPGVGGLSEFDTQGTGNIYELDTLPGGVIPEPGTIFALTSGLIVFASYRRKRA